MDGRVCGRLFVDGLAGTGYGSKATLDSFGEREDRVRQNLLKRFRPLAKICTVLGLACAVAVIGLGAAPALRAATPAKVAAPKTADLDQRLAAAGLVRGAAVLLRVFKEESELELWMQSGDTYKRFATYPICRWRGVLGPKLVEGDRQSPEGFYAFGQDHLIWQGHYFRAFNLNFPNALDQALGRTGSGLLIHGACSSIGCYAMTDAIIDEMFDLIVASLANGQGRVQVHSFPFHMTDANLKRHASSPWIGFWRDLKAGSDAFIATQVPPRVGVCDGRYVVRPGIIGTVQGDRVRDWCPTSIATGNADRLDDVLAARRAAAAPPEAIASVKPPSERIKLYAKLASEGQIPKPKPLPGKPSSYGPSPSVGAATAAGAPIAPVLASLPNAEREALLGVRKPRPPRPVFGAAGGPSLTGDDRPGAPTVSAFSCNPSLPACRHFMANNAARPIGLRKAKTRLANQ
jgi:murein L,D-transpeptidase YafK